MALSSARACLVGLASGLAVALGLGLGGRLGGDLQLALVALPPLALGATALFSPPDGWRGRLARSALAAALASALGIAAVRFLSRRTDWFEWPDENGAALFLLLLVALAAIPGGIAAAADAPRRGLALAAGFSLGLGGPLVFARPTNIGMLVLLAIGTLTGALVCAFGRARARRGS